MCSVRCVTYVSGRSLYKTQTCGGHWILPISFVAWSLHIPSFSDSESIASSCCSLMLLMQIFWVIPMLLCRKIAWMVLSSTPSPCRFVGSPRRNACQPCHRGMVLSRSKSCPSGLRPCANLRKAIPLRQGDVERNLRVIRTESNLMGMRALLVLQVSVNLNPFELLTNSSLRRTESTASSSSLRASFL
jgi:hypothetical protein